MKRKSLLSLVAIATLSNLYANESNLGDITVTSASGFEQKLTTAPASISVISQDDLHKKPYTNLLDALKDIEGVDIGETRDKSGQGSISIRGMGGDYTLILIDGKKQNNNGDIYPNNFGGFQNANLPPLEAIERIEVVRGPMSTLYGADAMGGVVNIITKKVTDNWIGSFTQSQTFQSDSQFGNDKTTDFSMMGPIIKDKLGLQLRGSFYDKEESNPETNSGSTFGGAGKTMDNQNWSLGTGLVFTPNDKHTIRLDYDVMRQKYDNSEGQVGTIDTFETLYNNQRVGYDKTQRMEREQYSLTYETIWDIGKSTIGMHHITSENLGRSLPLNALQRKYIEDNKAGWADLDAALADPIFASLMPRPERALKSETTTYDAKLEMPFDNHFVVVGAQYIQAEVEDGVFGMNNSINNDSGVVSSYDQWALFAEDSWSILNNLTLTTGVRYDDHETFGSHISPRAYLVYNPTANWTFKGGVATGYKTPKTTDLYEGVTGFGGQGTKPWFGNPDLKPEESLNTEVAAYYEHPKGHNFNITLFKNDFKDKIERSTDNVDVPAEWSGFSVVSGQMQNIDNAEIRGLEIAGKYQLLDNLTVKANYTFTDSKRDDTNDPLSSSAKHLYNLTLDWQTTPKWNNYLTMSGEKDRWRGGSGSRGFSPLNEDDFDYYKDYQVFDLGSSYKISKDITFNARVNNLFDKDFTETVKYLEDDGVTESETYTYNLAQKRRELWLSLNIKF